MIVAILISIDICALTYFHVRKFKANADNKLNDTQNVQLGFHWVENVLGKREKRFYQYFFHFP